MSDRDAFLAAIAEADEGDLAPYLVYADWLEEQGDPQAEFIRLQCAESPSVADELRMRWLEMTYRTDWSRDLRGKLGELDVEIGYRRGIPATLAMDMEQFRQNSAGLIAAWPGLSRVSLSPSWGAADGPVVKLTAKPLECPWSDWEFFGLGVEDDTREIIEWLERGTRRVRFERCPVSARSVNTLAHKPWRRSVRTLEFSACGIGGALDGLPQIQLPELKHLVLERNRINGPQFAKLVSAPWFPQLRSFSIGDNGLQGATDSTRFVSPALEHLDLSTTELVSQLETIPHLECPNLTSLFLREARLTKFSVECLDALCPEPSLRRLDLSGNPAFGDDGLRHLANSRHMRNLESLRIAKCGVEAKGLIALAQAKGRGLSELDIELNPLTSMGLRAVLDSGHAATLRALRLSGRPGLAQEDFLKALVTAMRPLKLDELWMAQPFASRAWLRELIEQEVLGTARAFRMTGGQLDGESITAFASSPSVGRLLHLDLSENSLLDPGAIELARSMTLRSLRSLSLENNGIGPSGIRALLESPALSQLTSLNLCGNDLDSNTAALLADKKVLPNLLTVGVSHGALHPRDIERLRARFGGRLRTT